MSFHAPSVTELPNHWCESSCATSRIDSHSSTMKLRPNVDRPWDSSGISRSSSVMTQVYDGNGYGPKISAKYAIIFGWSPKAASYPSGSAGRGVTRVIGTTPSTPCASICATSYCPICTEAR